MSDVTQIEGKTTENIKRDNVEKEEQPAAILLCSTQQLNPIKLLVYTSIYILVYNISYIVTYHDFGHIIIFEISC